MAAVGITLCKGSGARMCNGRSYEFIARRSDGQGNVGEEREAFIRTDLWSAVPPG